MQLLKLPIARHIVAAVSIVLLLWAFSIRPLQNQNASLRNDLTKLSEKQHELISQLAKKDTYKIENKVQDTKLKKGGVIKMVPENHLEVFNSNAKEKTIPKPDTVKKKKKTKKRWWKKLWNKQSNNNHLKNSNMGLPKVVFNINADGLERLSAGIGKVPGMVITGNTVAGKVQLGKSYQIFGLKQAVAMGIESEGVNAFAYKQIADFYKEAGEGAELWFMLVSDATTQEQMADANESYAAQLISDASGNIRVLGLAKKSPDNEPVENAISTDAAKAVDKAEQLAECYEDKYMPLRVVVAGNSFSGVVSELADYQESSYPHVAMLLSNNDGSKSADIGLAMGRLSAVPSQRSIARVKDGPVESFSAYFTNGEKVEKYIDAWDSIHDKGYIFLRNYVGRSGFYFSDDNTLVSQNNDFSSLGRGLVMDEAMLITYDTLLQELNDEIPMTESGQIHPAIIKNWQTNVEAQLQGLMVVKGKLSSAACFIDDNQNVLANDKILVKLKLQPVGYAKTIEVEIGFATKTV